MDRRQFIKTLPLGALTACSASWPTACGRLSQTSPRPNIVFIFADDHAAQAISGYGSKINTTPNIDRLAREGALFRNNFCANSICAPSRATVLTGKHSHLIGQRGNRETFDGSQQTFPQLLKKAGYKTGLFGKWHLKSDPTGFDDWMVYPGQGDYYNPDYLTSQGKTRIPGYCVEITTDLTLDWLKKQKNSERPFLLMCQYKAPHAFWMPGPKYLTLYDDVTIPEPENLFDDYKGRTSSARKSALAIGELIMRLDSVFKIVPAGQKTTVEAINRLTPEQRKIWDSAYEPKNKRFREANLEGRDLLRWKYQRFLKDYLRCVAAVDDNVGRLLDYIEESGLAENTIVIYSSDQGFFLGEHGWFDKRWMYEESLRMPLIMRWPGLIKPGTEITRLTQNIDFAPTLLAAAGLEIPEDMQGKSMVPLLNNPKAKWRDAIYYHYYGENYRAFKIAAHYGIRTLRYKLIHFYEAGEWELFDLEKDPQEMTSLYADPGYAKIRSQLQRKLKELRVFYNEE